LRFFGAVLAWHAHRQWLTSTKITTLWGHGLGEKWGSEKKNFSKKKFFPRNFSASFSTSYRRHLGSKTTARTRRSYLIPFPSYGGPKIFAKKILTPVSENLVDRFRYNSLKRLHSLRPIRIGSRKDLKWADFEKFAPKICDVNPHSFFCILGVYPFSKSDDSNVVGCSMSFWDQYFLPRPFISTPSRDINFFGYCLHFGLGGFRRVRSRVNHMTDSWQVDHSAISYRGSTCKPRAEAATLCDTVMARNRFFNINYINCTINGSKTNKFKRR
jgi:hypothetical protein